MFVRSLSKLGIGGLALAVCAARAPVARARITFEFDYSRDSTSFFDANTADGQAARAAIERAARVYSDRLIDRLSAITPTSNSWQATFADPRSNTTFAVTDLAVAADTIKVYAGARGLGADVARGGAGGYNVFTSNPALATAIRTRGQAGADAPTPTDFGPWGGSVTLNYFVSGGWHTGTAAPAAGQYDLQTVALHELGHVLGLGTADSWKTHLTATVTPYGDLQYVGPYTGPKSAAIYGGSVPLETPPTPASASATVQHASHFAAGVTGTVGVSGPQPALFGPTVPAGVRRQLTGLDWAALDDLGWSLARPGDADANGAVDLNDLVILSNNYGRVAGDATWAEGDFDYDGNVSLNDLVALSNAYGVVGALGDDPPPSPSPDFAADWAYVTGTAVPEPAGLCGLGLIGLVALRRRR